MSKVLRCIQNILIYIIILLMSNYNIFIVYDCAKRKPILVTPSARKAKRVLCKGVRIDVWNKEECVACIYNKEGYLLKKYVDLEKQYIARKQERATKRNALRKQRRENKLAGGNLYG